MKKYDLTIVGSGAGLMLVEPALQAGLSVAFVEKSKFGGTCLTRGCIPSKMLVYPADLIREAQRSGRVGVHLDALGIDWNKIASRMWAQIAHSDRISEGLSGVDGLDVYRGTGAFTGPHTFRVTSERLEEHVEFESDRFILAPGGRTLVPSIEGLEQTGYVTSESFFGEKFPAAPWRKLVIVGAGAVGAEFAHIFSAFGSKVTLVERLPMILPTEDEEISIAVQKEFEHNGIEVLTHHQLVFAGRDEKGKYVLVENSNDPSRTRIDTDEIFIASGLRPNSDWLGIENANIKTDERGWIKTDEYLKTNQDHIWAIGDINGIYPFRHKANYEAGILIGNLFGADDPKPVRYHSVPWAIFTCPQVAHVGMTEKQALERGIRVFVGRNRFSDIAAGSAMGISENDSDNGFVKIVIDEQGKLIGAHVVGHQAALLVQPFVYLMNTGYMCDSEGESDRTRLERPEIRPIRRICRQLGTIMPVMNSMVIHPSLNELTAWALSNLHAHDSE